MKSVIPTVSLEYFKIVSHRDRLSGFRNGEILLVEPGVLGFGIPNSAQEIWNPANDWLAQVSIIKVHKDRIHR